MPTVSTRSLIALVFCICASSFAATGCAVGADGGGPAYAAPVEGRLTLRWTVDEVTNPNLCRLRAATAIDVQLTTSGGVLAGEYRGVCTDLSTSIPALAPGGYGGIVRLLDDADQPRTTAVTLNPFTVRAGEELILDIDFPADSFL